MSVLPRKNSGALMITPSTWAPSSSDLLRPNIRGRYPWATSQSSESPSDLGRTIDRIAATGDSTDAAGLERLDTRSLSGRVRDELLKAIRSESFPDGRLPPEADLALQLGVSRTTVRAALQSLADDGIVSRRRRHGTLINQHLLRSSMPLNRLVSFRALIEQSGHVPSVDPQVHAPRRADEAVAEALGVAQGTECLMVRRLLRAGDDPVIHITDTVPLGGLPALAEIVE